MPAPGTGNAQAMANLIRHRPGSALAAVWLTLIGGASTTLACGYHGAMGERLSAMHPGSVQVAVALRRAADSRVVDAKALDEIGRRPTLYLETVRRLHAFKRAFNGAIDRAPGASDPGMVPHFSVGLVESGLWTRFSPGAEGLRIEVHTQGPDVGETVLLTGEPVLAGLLDGSLPISEAMAQSLIVLDGDPQSQAALREALSRLPPGPTRAGLRLNPDARP